jgi:hypothetical protein
LTANWRQSAAKSRRDGAEERCQGGDEQFRLLDQLVPVHPDDAPAGSGQQQIAAVIGLLIGPTRVMPAAVRLDQDLRRA